ncbi:MAG: lipid-A-disaccharide synthase [Candidatus Rokubacteria bacterium]|nr:lipid-A-disaccharide synthase [Candidatus Rokubacteria bacterium]
MLVAGEASGDLHGAALAGHLRRLAPSVSLTGMGGPRMAEAGVCLLSDVTRLAVVGAGEAVSRLPGFYRAYRGLVRRLREHRPRSVVLIDFPEFNLRLARAAKRLGIPVIYFIPPQVWAWRRGRVRIIGRLTTRVLVIFPFEVPLYQAVGARVEFVGHPLLDRLVSPPTRREARGSVGVPAEAMLVGLLPGSRSEEVRRLLPEMMRAAGLIRDARPDAEFVLALAPTVDETLVSSLLAPSPVRISVVAGQTHEVMAAADLLLVASGTATLEAALIGTPMVVCYRVSRVSELVGRLLIRIPWISLANIVAGRPVVPELLQDDATAARMAEETLRLLGSPAALAAQRAAFAEIRGRLGTAGVGERAALSVLEVAGVPAVAPLRGREP